MISGFHTGDLNPIRTVPMLGTHKDGNRWVDYHRENIIKGGIDAKSKYAGSVMVWTGSCLPNCRASGGALKAGPTS